MTIDTKIPSFPILYDLDAIAEVAGALIKRLEKIKIWLFEGEMGAGKTTLVKAICDVLKVEDNVTSPTFSIVNEYSTKVGSSIYHFDFYRIKSEVEVMDIGHEEYFYSGNLCLIEWPSKIPNLLPENYATIKIDILDNNRRRCNVVEVNG